ncbi:NfeD family protein [Qipengyuania marisflavi]|nr:NfeD family protein [Qipengyuania marisflavi]
MDGIEPHWVWIIIGLALAALELVVPGVYLIWLAVAALVTGLLVFISDPPLAIQVISFVSLALIAAYSAKRFLRDRPIVSADPLLNNRAGRLVGETALVTKALDGGTGRVQVGDSEWMARGSDVAVGTRVRITGISGTALTVEPLTLLTGEGTAPLPED